MQDNESSCHSCFLIQSNGIIENMVGFIANSNSDFDPNYITEKLGIEPFEVIKMNTARKNRNGLYTFSKWSACKETEPSINAQEQVLKIIRTLKPKIPALLELKKEYDITFTINIVPYIYNEQAPIIYFNKEIIEFCYLTGTEIDVDLYVFDKE